MSRSKESSDLGISLKDMATILETGKKITRGAKNQLKVQSLQRQVGQRQSEVSFDSKRSIETKKEGKRSEKNKRKEGSVKQLRVSMSEFMGVPDIEGYIASETLQPQTCFNPRKFNLSQLGKNQLPSLVLVLLKNNLSREVFEVRRGELKRQKTTKDQFLVEFPHYTQNRNQVRSITKDNGIVMVGSNLMIIKINFNQWKTIFKEEIHELRKTPNLHPTNTPQKPNLNQPKLIDTESGQIQKGMFQGEGAMMQEEKTKAKEKNKQFNQEGNISEEIITQRLGAIQSIGKQKLQKIGPQQKMEMQSMEAQKQQSLKAQKQYFTIEEEGSLSFVDILPNQSGELQQNNESLQKSQCMQQIRMRHDKIVGGHLIEESQLGADNSAIEQIQLQKRLTDEELFSKFCIPGCEFMLWPVLLYDPVLGSGDELASIVQKQTYFFSDKNKSSLFDTIANSLGIFQLSNHSQKISSSIILRRGSVSAEMSAGENIEQQKLLKHFNSKIRDRIDADKKIIQQPKTQNQSQLNFVYLFGLNKLICIQSEEQASRKLIPWNSFDKYFVDYYFLSTPLKNIVEELCQTIQRLNEFSRQQVSQIRSEDIRNSIDRLVKCQIDNKIYNGIAQKYSNMQKKMLVLVFESSWGSRNKLHWLNLQQVYPNCTVPQIGAKSKFLLYFSNSQREEFQGKTLSDFIYDIFPTFFHRQTNSYSSIFDSVPKSQIPLLNRCVECHYPIHRLQYYKCCFCNNYCHKECSSKTINKNIEIKGIYLLNPNQNQTQNDIQNLWTCDSCEPCAICVQPLRNDRIACIKCKTVSHQTCGKLKIQDNTIHLDRYLCENCIQCKVCQKKLKNLDYIMIKGGYQCLNCYKAEQANEICQICKKQGDGRWAQCSRQYCGKWIHKNCDGYIQSRNNLFSTNNEEMYFCPFCRRVEKRRIILKFIEILSVFDEYQYFIASDYEDLLDYKYVILNPMCFRKMHERCHEGIYDDNTLEVISKDFDLIISNALKYNMPKDQPHYQARILNILGKHTIQKFRHQLECTQEQLVQGHLPQRMFEKKRELYREVYDHYLEIILNYGSKHSTVEVKRPKQSVKGMDRSGGKGADRLSQVTEVEQYGFSSRHLLKEVFRSSMLKFKIKKKAPTIENLFEIQKFVEAFKSPIKQNFCYYHYWNSDVIFYCNICMEYYCCLDKCYRHNLCSICGMKGCACEVYECGCPGMKEKEKKHYEKLLNEKFYDRRELTQNYKLCLKCAWEKLTTKACLYCEKSYEFYYDFESCSLCRKLYHKECADGHATEALAHFFFKTAKLTGSEELFSSTLRLPGHCYECSINKENKVRMFQKLKRDSLTKLAKIQKLSRFQLLIASIYQDNGIRLTLPDILNILLNNYDDFLQFQPIFEQYRLNLPSIKLATKLNCRVDQRLQSQIRKELIEPFSDNQKTSELSNLIKFPQKQTQTINAPFFLAKQSIENFNVSVDLLWRHKVFHRVTQLLIQNLFNLHNPLQHCKTLKTQFLLQKFQSLKIRTKINKITFQSASIITQSFYPINPLMTRKNTGQSFGSGGTEKSFTGLGKILFRGNAQKISKSNLQKEENQEIQQVLLTLLGFNSCFKTFGELQFIQIQKRCKQTQNNLTHTIQNCCYYPYPYQSQSLLAAGEVSEDLTTTNFIMDHSLVIQRKKQEQQQIISPKKLTIQNSITDKSCHYFPAQDLDHLLQLQIEKRSLIKASQFVQYGDLQQRMSSIHQKDANFSKFSKFNHLSTIHSIISRFLLKCFELSKSAYRRGNTCLLKTQKSDWRVLKKSEKKGKVYQLSLKKQGNKWFFAINQNVWWVESIGQIISKLQGIANLNNFRELADFLGFTFRLVPMQKADHFSKFLQTRPLDHLSPKQKKIALLKLYEKYQWIRNGSCKNKVTDENRNEAKEFVSTKKPIFYLRKRTKNMNQRQSSDESQLKNVCPYITYQDLKKDLQDKIVQPEKTKQPIFFKQPKPNTVFIGPSPIHKLGLFATNDYPKYTTMIQYVGQIVSQSNADLRESVFHFGCYMFGLNRRNVDRREIIDATFKGNMARYLNHSCEPNCKAKIELLNNHPRIFIYSIRNIQQFEELTYDYQFSVDANQKLVCTCGARNCQGRLN